MTSRTSTLRSFTDAAADAVAREIAGLRCEAQREREVCGAEYRARMAELDAKIERAADLEHRLAERIAALKDGADGRDGADGINGNDGAPGRDGVDGTAGADGKDGVDGVDGKDGADGAPGRDGVDGTAGADGKDGVDGIDGRDGADGAPGRDGLDVGDILVRQTGSIVEFVFQVGDTRTLFEVELPIGPAGRDGIDGAPGEQGTPGRMVGVKYWAAGVHYAGDIRTYRGATWQANRDTADEPPSDDWTCIAERGVDGKDGQSFNPRRLWAPADDYRRLDVVALNGGSFVALADDPGPCPGPGWMLLTQQGKRGEKGERGERGMPGERGAPAEPVVALAVDDQGMLTLTNGDGTRVQCDLYPVLVRAASTRP